MDSSIKRKYFVPGLYQKHRRVPKILNNYDFDSSYLQKPRENFTAKCKLCGKTVRASMRVTTNFVNHMKKFHPCIQSESISSFLSDEKSQSSPTSNINTGILDSKIVSTLIRCSIPLTVLEMSAFRGLLVQLNPDVLVAAQSNINDEIVPNLVDQTKTQMNELLSQTDSLSLVLDYWSLNESQFVSLFSHLIDQEWNQQTLMLGCQQISEIDEISSFVENCLLEYKLKSKIFSLCLTSSTGLSLEEIMEKLSLNCLKFYSCSMFLEEVVNQALNGLPLFNPKKTSLDTLLNNKYDLSSDCGLSEDLISIFKPFNELKSDLEKDSASISVIYPAYKGLKTHLSFFKKFKANDIAQELDKSLEEKLGYVKSMPVFSVAAMLNPNFGFSWIDENDHSENEKILSKQFLKEIKTSKDSHAKDVKINAPKKSYLCLSKTVGGDSEYSNELNSYIMYVKGFSYDENFCLLEFWKSNAKTYPNLSSFVKKIFSALIGLTEREKFLQKFINKMELENNLEILPSILFLKFNN